MKRKTILMAVFMLLLSVSLAHALPQYTISTTLGRLGNGGPFQITGVTDPSVSFQTFCVEGGEFIDLNHTYWGSIDSLVYYSSGSSTFSAAIAPKTAKLYNYFLDHVNDSILTFTYSDRHDIQLAIWESQGQAGGVANSWYINALALSATERDVFALNLWCVDVGPVIDASDYDYRKQSQLIAIEPTHTQTPEPGSLLLMGLGLIGLAGLRRKNKE